MASCEYGEGMAAIRGRGGRSRSRDLPNPDTSESNGATLRSVSLYTESLLHELRVLREASITSCEYYEYQKKEGWERRSRRAASNPRPPTNKSLRT